MTTPIADFITAYASAAPLRLHMPGHKGIGPLGCERFDVTEVAGADALYEAAGIIRESEDNASALFGSARTLYSTEGASQCVRAMVYLALTHRAPDAAPRILAARNAHRSFISACALCGAEVDWLWPETEGDGLLACPVTPEGLTRALNALPEKPAAVYVTSPDYLGNLADVSGLAKACHLHGIPLLVDNAHGAYLRFLSPEAVSDCRGASRSARAAEQDMLCRGGSPEPPAGRAAEGGGPCVELCSPATEQEPFPPPAGEGAAAAAGEGETLPYRRVSLHPLDAGADLVCDSAHKTLPVLTGGAWLHISKAAAPRFADPAKRAMALFGSTSPSYLTLASLDRCNALLAGEWPGRLAKAARDCEMLKDALRGLGWTLGEGDPLRVTLYCDGKAAAQRLRARGIEPEYAGPEALVLMLTPEVAETARTRVPAALGANDLPPAPPPPVLPKPERVLPPRGAMLAPQVRVPAAESVGRVCGAPTVGCPPAVPIVAAGERIPPEAAEAFRYYGVESVDCVSDI
ncbi:MAG: amino acid decarboxylase [Oscillospiraceae bacterium]|nr:amino acid decarboxylase [Oscillospiraceae bacterium]